MTRALLAAVAAVAVLTAGCHPAAQDEPTPHRSAPIFRAASPAPLACTPVPEPPADAAANSDFVNDGMPPGRFRKPTVAVLKTVPADQVTVACSDGPPPCGMIIEACSFKTDKGDSVVITPDPCDYPDQDYARLVCHELGHVNGWPGWHGD